MRPGVKLFYGAGEFRHTKEKIQQNGLMPCLHKGVAGQSAAGKGNGPLGGKPAGQNGNFHRCKFLSLNKLCSLLWYIIFSVASQEHFFFRGDFLTASGV